MNGEIPKKRSLDDDDLARLDEISTCVDEMLKNKAVYYQLLHDILDSVAMLLSKFLYEGVDRREQLLNIMIQHGVPLEKAKEILKWC